MVGPTSDTPGDQPASIPISVIGGYLGAGKTTLLNSILRRSDSVRFGVIVNDFGELGIDADLLAEAAADNGVINLPNGCVCCTLGADLYEALAALAAVEPRLDQIVIEASGVADPAATAAWGTVAPFAPGGTIVLAAADTIRTQASDRYVGTEVVRQLTGADIVVVTKGDRCNVEQLDAVESWLTDQTSAPMIRSLNGDVPMTILRPAAAGASLAEATERRPRESSGHGMALAAIYSTWSFESATGTTADRLEMFLAELPDGVLRLKGTVADSGGAMRGILVNVVGKRIDLAPIECEGPVIRLEAIGVNGLFDEREVERLAVKYLRPG